MGKLNEQTVRRAATMLGFPRNRELPRQDRLVARIVEQTGWNAPDGDLPKKQKRAKQKSLILRYCKMQGLIADRGMGGRVENSEAGVYIMQQQGGEECFKVGASKKSRERQKELQTGSPYPLKVVAEIKAEDMTHARWMEQAIHKKLNKYRLSGEWFRKEALPYIAHAVTESNTKVHLTG